MTKGSGGLRMGAWKQAIIKILGHLFELDQKTAKICFWRNIDVYCVFFYKGFKQNCKSKSRVGLFSPLTEFLALYCLYYLLYYALLRIIMYVYGLDMYPTLQL